VASLGSLKGWLITAGIWGAVIGLYLAATTSSWERSRVRLDASLAEVIRCDVPVETVVGPFTDMDDAADDYDRAVQEYNGTDRYSGYFALAAEKTMEPDLLDIRAPQYLLSGASKARMNYARRFAQAADWTSLRVGYVKAFDTIGQICLLKADLLLKTGRMQEAEALLKAVVAFGYHIEQERVRYSQTVTGVALQKRACRMLLQMYKQADQTARALTVEEYIKALQMLQDKMEGKASSTIARLEDASPSAGAMFWLVDNDKDRMWQIEGILMLGLTQWTAPRAADQRASRERLTALAQHATDPMLNDAAKAALGFTREDVRKVR
jgi:tetratricopeptide (TPR) repeat protein